MKTIQPPQTLQSFIQDVLLKDDKNQKWLLLLKSLSNDDFDKNILRAMEYLASHEPESLISFCHPIVCVITPDSPYAERATKLLVQIVYRVTIKGYPQLVNHYLKELLQRRTSIPAIQHVFQKEIGLRQAYLEIVHMGNRELLDSFLRELDSPTVAPVLDTSWRIRLGFLNLGVTPFDI